MKQKHVPTKPKILTSENQYISQKEILFKKEVKNQTKNALNIQ